MASLEHLFYIVVEDVGEELFDIESILCDEYSSMRKGWGGSTGMLVKKRSSGTDLRRATNDLRGMFLSQVDLSRQTVEQFCSDVRRMVWRSAGRYVRIALQGFVVEDDRYIIGDESEYKKLEEAGELKIDIDDEWEDEDE